MGKAKTKDAPTAVAEIPPEVTALLEDMRLRLVEAESKLAERETVPVLPVEPEEARITPSKIQGEFRGQETYGKITPKTRPELYEPMVEHAIPEALHPDECLFAVKLQGQGGGYWRAFPRPHRTVPLADPTMDRLIPKLQPGDMKPLELLTEPLRNLIGHGSVIPWFLPYFKQETFCDPRAAAAAGMPVIEGISLWCPLFEADHPNSVHHSEHGAFCGVGEQPDRVQQTLDTDEDAGRCVRCRDHRKKRHSTYNLVESIRGQV